MRMSLELKENVEDIMSKNNEIEVNHSCEGLRFAVRD